MDTISLRSLSTHATIGPDSWARLKPQPLLLSLYLTLDTASAARTDDLAHTFSYGVMAKDVLGAVSGRKKMKKEGKEEGGGKDKDQDFGSVEHLTADLAEVAAAWPGEKLRIVVHAPKALLRSTQGLQHEVCLLRRGGGSGVETETAELKQQEEQKAAVWHAQRHSWSLSGLRVSCIIGVNAHERREKQDVLISIQVSLGLDGAHQHHPRHNEDGEDEEREDESVTQQITEEGPQLWRRLARGVCEGVEETEFETLEALAAYVARFCLRGKDGEGGFPFPRVTVGVEKPSAVTFAEGAGVEITRDGKWVREEFG